MREDVASMMLTEPEWADRMVLSGEAASAMRELKAKPGKANWGRVHGTGGAHPTAPRPMRCMEPVAYFRRLLDGRHAGRAASLMPWFRWEDIVTLLLSASASRFLLEADVLRRRRRRRR